MKVPARILIAPLNWGLGHASRCIPIIKELIHQGAEVFLASDGRAAQLLKEEFPELPLRILPAYGISYPSRNMIFNMALQFPKLLRAVYAERKVIEKIVKEENITAVISDNRYGCYTPAATSIFLTHQLRIQTPFNWLDDITERVNKYLLSAFDEIWVPDYAGEDNLSGRLSHNGRFTRQQYLGPLSRMKAGKQAIAQDVAIVLSGPEPQRTKLEEELLNEARRLTHLRFLFIQGKTENFKREQLAPHIQCISYLTSQELNQALLGSRYIVSRSGYSTIMDLYALSRSALLIPTPGQTEQEYLVTHFEEQGTFAVQKQGAINLEKGLKALEQCSTLKHSGEEPVLTKVIQDLLEF